MATPGPKRPRPVKFDTSSRFGANVRPKRGGVGTRPGRKPKGGGS